MIAMIKTLFCTIVSLLCYWICAQCFAQPFITTNPQTELGYVGDRLSFTCQASRGEKFWKINGTFAELESDDPYNAIVEYGMTSRLYVDASVATNNSVVTCWLYYPPHNEESSARIIVQGKVGAPGNLAVNVDSHQMQITWSSPYTLPGTRMTFLVNVTVDGHLNSAVTSDNHYNVSLLTIGINSCYSSYSIHITISGINPAGEGEPASFVTVIPQKQNCSNSLTPNQTQPNGALYVWMLSSSVSEYNCTLNVEWINLLPKYVYIVEVHSPPNNTITGNTTATSYVIKFSTININPCVSNSKVEIMVYPMTSSAVPIKIKKKILQDEKYCFCGSDSSTMTSPYIPNDPTTRSRNNYTLRVSLISITSAVVLLTLLFVTGISIALVVIACYAKRRKIVTVIYNPKGLPFEDNRRQAVYNMNENDSYTIIANKSYANEEPHIYEDIATPASPSKV